MFRLSLLSLLACAMFMACSSDDSSPLKEWFDDQGIALSYKMEAFEADISVKSVEAGFDSSAFMVSSFAALGKVNGLEHELYFGLAVKDSLKSNWRLRTDSLFYGSFYEEDKFPINTPEIKAEFCWREMELDTNWLKNLNDNVSWKGCDTIPNAFNWKVTKAEDTSTVDIVSEKLLEYSKKDSIDLLVRLRLINNEDFVLRIAPPSPSEDISGLVLVAQKSRALEECKTCLYAGVKDSVNISFEINDELEMLNNKTVVFAQLDLPKTDANAKSEFEHPIIVYAHSKFGNEEYIVDTAYVREHGHPNMLFGERDNETLKLQFTKALRNYGALPDKNPIFTLSLGSPMPALQDTVFNFYASALIAEYYSVARPDYAKYDFGNLKGQKAKLKIWLADYGDKK